MIDIVLVFLFLLLTAVIGYIEGKKINSIKEFAVAHQGYGIPVLIATIFATVIGGGSTLGVVEKVYQYGYIFVLPFLGMALNRIVVGKYFAKHISYFHKNSISLGDIMEFHYGAVGKYIAGISITLVSIGSVGTQVFAVGQIFHHLLDISHLYGVLISFGIIIMYSSFGGMRSVVATDVLQFIFIVVMMPILFSICIKASGGINLFAQNLVTHAVTKENSIFLSLIVFLSFLLSSGDPSFLQRLLIAKDIKRASRSMILTGYLSIAFYLLIAAIGVVASITYPNIEASGALIFIIKDLIPPFLKGIVICGLLAAIMSTADSDLNMVGISVVHELLPEKLKSRLSEKQKLLISRLSTFILGTFSVLIALQFTNILDIMIYAFSFWGPGVLIPLAMGILGYKVESVKYMAVGVLIGSLSTLIWNFYLKDSTNIPGLIIGMGLHFLFFIVKSYKIREIKI